MATRTRTRMLTLDELVAAARRLSPRDRLRLIERLAAELEPSVSGEVSAREPAPSGQAGPSEHAASESDPTAPNRPTPGPSLYGLWQGIVPEISAEEFAELRREAWKNFPREHFFIEEAE